MSQLVVNWLSEGGIRFQDRREFASSDGCTPY